jgi:ribosomal protein L37AE/L43A
LAFPLCQRKVLRREGNHGWQSHCYAKLSYNLLHNWWRCPECDHIVSGGAVAARRMAQVNTKAG